MNAAPDPGLVEMLRRARRSAGDLRKIFLALYGLLLLVPLCFLLVAAGRALLGGDQGDAVLAVFQRPVPVTVAFVRDAVSMGAWGTLLSVGLAMWIVAMLVGSWFGLAITRMAAVELTCERRADLAEARRFANKHWVWAFVTPACLLLGALLLLGAAAALLSLGRFSDWLVVAAAPAALLLSVTAVVLLAGLLGGGILAWPTIATEWSDAFDAITRVYGYSFAHSYRVLLYRAGGLVAWLGAVCTRGFRAVLVLGIFLAALLFGLGRAKTKTLLDGVLLEPPAGAPFPETAAAWTLLACGAVFLSLLVARLLVFRLVLHQGIYLLLRQRIDRVPLDNIDGYRPDDSAYDPTAQGFELVEVEEEIPAE